MFWAVLAGNSATRTLGSEKFIRSTSSSTQTTGRLVRPSSGTRYRSRKMIMVGRCSCARVESHMLTW